MKETNLYSPPPGRDMTLRGKIAKGMRRQIQGQFNPHRGVRPPIHRRVLGRRAVLGWHKKVDRQLSSMEKLVKQNKERWINGDIKRPSEFGPSMVNLTPIDPYFETLIAGLGGVMATSAGQLLLSPGNNGTTSMKVGFAVGAAVPAFLHLSDSTKWYNRYANDYAKLVGILRQEKLMISSPNISQSKVREHNRKIVRKIEDAITRLFIDNNQMTVRLQG